MANIMIAGKLVTVIGGVQGPAGPPGMGSNTLVYVQSSASGEWTVNHNLGIKPLVTVFNNNDEEVGVNVRHISSNQFKIFSDTPFLGYALYK